MSLNLTRRVRRFGKEKQRFTFSVQVHKIDLGVDFTVELSVVWTRGARTAKTSWVRGEKGCVEFEPKPLSLLCTMYKIKESELSVPGKGPSFEKKRSRLLIKQKKSSGREKQVGCVELNLSDYVGPNCEHELELPIARCSSKSAKIYFTLRCQYLAISRDDDTFSVSSMSVVSVGSQNFEPVGDSEAPVTGEPGAPHALNAAAPPPASDVGNLSSLDGFEIKGRRTAPSTTTPNSAPTPPGVPTFQSTKPPGAAYNPPSRASTNPFALKKSKQEEVDKLIHDKMAEQFAALRTENEALKRRALMGYSGDAGSYNDERRELMNALKLARAETSKIKMALVMEKASNNKMKEMLEKECAIYRSKRVEFEDTQHIAEAKDRRIAELTEQLHKERQLNCDLDTRTRELQMDVEESYTKRKELDEMLALAKEELAGLHKERGKMERNYQDVLKAMEMAPNDLIKSIGFFRSQYHDLENTLLMVRKSWKETGNIMQTQITALKNELVNTKVENERLKNKAHRDANYFRQLKLQVGKLQTEKFKLSERLSANEVKLAKKTVDHVTCQNDLQAAQEKLLQMRREKIQQPSTPVLSEKYLGGVTAESFEIGDHLSHRDRELVEQFLTNNTRRT